MTSIFLPPPLQDYAAHQHDTSDLITGILPVERGGTGVSASPCFSVDKNSVHQTIPASTWTKVLFAGERVDTNNNFDSSRFTPTVVGPYWLSATIQYNPDIGNGAPAGARLILSIWKNGVEYKRTETIATLNSYAYPQVSATCTANGSTDYFEIYTYIVAGVALTIGGESVYTYWSGHKT